jgi:alpha-tubulin suppressor-like RCC1 family protein
MADTSSPVAVVADGIFTQVTAGFESGYGLRADGAVFAWGDNTYGQLGDNSQTQRDTPVRVVGGHIFNYIAAGWNHILGIKSNGSVFTWGDNSLGQLGDGTSVPSSASSPQSVVGGHEFVKVDAGECHSIGLKADGSIWTWGCNESGQLGTILQAGAIGAGAQGFGSAIDQNGVLWMWGANISGQLGDNTTTNKSSPVTVAGPQGWGVHPDIPTLGMDPCLVPGNCGGIGQHSDNLSWATKTDGSLWMWGAQEYGQLGVGNWTTNYSSPRSVLGSLYNKFFAVASTGGGPASTYALGSDGHIYVWGYTGYILGGTAAALSYNSPVKVESFIFDARGPFDPFIGRVFRYLSAGLFGGLAGSGSRVWVWGANAAGYDGKLCLGDVVNHPSPTQISGIWIHGAHGQNHTVLINPFGDIYMCGYNDILNGMSPLLCAPNCWFGGGGPTNRSTPTLVMGSPHNAIKVATGQNSATHGFLREDGSLWMWGENDNGECGVGTITGVSSPSSVIGSGQSYRFVDFVIGGESGTVAIDDEGQVWGWGQWGHVGDNSTSNRSIPAMTLLNPITPEEFRASPTQLGNDVTGPFFTDIAAGNQHNIALQVDGSVWAWGDNQYGQLGLETIQNAIAPQSVVGGHSFRDIAAGIDFSYALKEDESIWAWGDNTCGKLGDGSTTDRSSPVSVAGF